MWNNGAKNSIASKIAKCTFDIAPRVDINATHEPAKKVDRLLIVPHLVPPIDSSQSHCSNWSEQTTQH